MIYFTLESVTEIESVIVLLQRTALPLDQTDWLLNTYEPSRGYDPRSEDYKATIIPIILWRQYLFPIFQWTKKDPVVLVQGLFNLLMNNYIHFGTPLPIIPLPPKLIDVDVVRQILLFAVDDVLLVTVLILFLFNFIYGTKICY